MTPPIPHLLLLFLLQICPTLSAVTQVITITGAPTSTAPPAQYTNSASFTSAILNSTNTYRQTYNASSVTWNDTLASYAQDASSTCVFEHTHGPYGENIAAGYANATAVVEAWGNEVVDYNFKDPGFGEDTGHFTQLVWKSTRQTGCGVSYCGGDGEGGSAPGWYVVCEYAPPGNVLGEFAQNVQSKVSAGARVKVGFGGLVAALAGCVAFLL